MFEIVPSKIPGCFQIIFKKLVDNRGAFAKSYHIDEFNKLGIDFKFAEEYFSSSTKNVFRGMHFQTPPKAIDKLMFCAFGAVTDYVIDIRVGSPTYGQWESFELNSENPSAVFVPKGLAHGFYTKSDLAIMQCKSSGVYDAPNDKTISYKSFSFAKEIINPILSEKDIAATPFDEFENPFTF